MDSTQRVLSKEWLSRVESVGMMKDATDLGAEVGGLSSGPFTQVLDGRKASFWYLHWHLRN